MAKEEAVTTLRRAAAAKRRADKRVKEMTKTSIDAFEAAVVEALTTGGLKPVEAAQATGYSYETIRRIARAHGVEPLREPTVTSRKKAGEAA